MTEEITSSRLEGTKLIIETSEGEQSYDSRFLVAALLVHIARFGGGIDPQESAEMIQLIEQHFSLESSESLELITRAMSELVDKPTLPTLLIDLGRTLTDGEKEDIALMGLKVIAADGRRDVEEIEELNRAMEAIDISPENIHRAFDRYFSESMPGE